MQNCVASARHCIHEGYHPQAEQPKVLSAVEDRIDELGAGIAQSRRTVALIKVIPHPHPAPTWPPPPKQAPGVSWSSPLQGSCAQSIAQPH